jgi:AhpD family alkylhydroperoxidase
VSDDAHPDEGRLAEFRAFRERMNTRILEAGNLEIRRFFALDDRAYQDGALDRRTKELLGLVASLVLRCDDCISYHVIRCREEGVSEEELFETLSIGLVVGGSIVIPHLRRAVALLDELAGAGAGPDATGSPGSNPT